MDEREETDGITQLRTGRHLRYSSVISTRPRPLEVDWPPPRDKWFRRVIHYWRYGYSHPDEDLLGVIEASGDALHVQVIAAKAALTGAQAQEAEEIRKELEEELDRPLPDFSTLLGFEARINALFPPAMARQRQWMLRDRFERVAPPGALEKWQLMRLQEKAAQAQAAPAARPEASAASGEGSGKEQPSQQGEARASGGGGDGGSGGSGSPDNAPAAPLTDAQADSSTLLSYIHANYLMTIGREKAVRDLKRWLLMRFWLFLLFLIPLLLAVWLLLWWNDMGEYWGLLLGLFLVAAAGRAGATTSVIRRLQTAISQNVLAADPVIELTALRTGKNEISMALVSASIFALLMWAFFASGIPQFVGFDGGLFPRALASPRAQAEAAAEPTPTIEEGAGGKNPSANQMATPGAPVPGAGEPEPTQSTSDDDGRQAGTEPTAPPAPAPVPPAVPPPPSTAGEEASGPSIRASLPPRLRGALERGEAEVRRSESLYRIHMARLSAAGGIGNWFERRRIRRDARGAIALAILVQQHVVVLFETGLSGARSRGDDEAARRWEADLNEEVAERTTLVGLSNAIDGEAKPTPSVACPEGKDCNPFRPLAQQLRLVDESDFFKLLLWAFIAGFAERFVPDMLDRVVARSRDASALGSDAEIAAQVRAGITPSLPPPAPPAPAAPADGDRSGP